jgi:hypothetical protein
MSIVRFQRKHYTHLDNFGIVYNQNLDPSSQSSSTTIIPFIHASLPQPMTNHIQRYLAKALLQT